MIQKGTCKLKRLRAQSQTPGQTRIAQTPSAVIFSFCPGCNEENIRPPNIQDDAPLYVSASIYNLVGKKGDREMRAVLCKEWAGPEKLVVEDVPSPAIRDGAVRLKVHAAGINFADLLLIAGQYQEKPAFPFIPGAEAAGVITEIGAGVSHLKVGDRVMALTGLGAFAEEVVI